MIYAWDNYPIRQFPGMWEWMALQIQEKKLAMPRIAFEEVAKITPDCSAWLKDKNLEQLPASNEIVHQALRIKGLLGIVDDNYHPRGVGENDIIIIATAIKYRAELISDEARQSSPPKERYKCKIPAVCGRKDVNVPCTNFIDYIKRSAQVF